jgi:uncharacterized protein YgiM (DUF1202 family)
MQFRHHLLSTVASLGVCLMLCLPLASAETLTIAKTGNLRSGASTDHEIIGRVTPGLEVTQLKKVGEWYEVRLPSGEVGWVHKVLVKQKFVALMEGVELRMEVLTRQRLPGQDVKGPFFVIHPIFRDDGTLSEPLQVSINLADEKPMWGAMYETVEVYLEFLLRERWTRPTGVIMKYGTNQETAAGTGALRCNVLVHPGSENDYFGLYHQTSAQPKRIRLRTVDTVIYECEVTQEQSKRDQPISDPNRE